MGNNQLKLSGGLRFGASASDLTPASAGLVYFNTSSNLLRLYDGSSWSSLALATSDFADNVFRISDDGDSTKKIAFQASGISTGTVRTITMPDANVDLGNLTNSNIAAGAAIAYSKLNLSNSIVNADIASGAAIAYSKLNLSASIVNADIASGAAIAYNKLAALTASRALQSDGSGFVSVSSVTSTELGYVSGVTSAIQTQIDGKLTNTLTDGNIFVGNASNVATSVNPSGDIDISNAGVFSINAGVIVDADVNASAAITLSKLAAVTASRALQSDASGFITASAVTNTELGYVSGVTSSIQTQLNNRLLLSGGTLTGFLTLHADPTSALHAATKQYVDSLLNGVDWKNSVRVATVAAGTLASSFENGDTVDGVVLATNDRILIKDQAAPEENGIYIVQASGSPVRSLDMDSWLEVPAAAVFVEEGTVNSDKGFVCTSNSGGTLGVTAITFVQFSSAGAFTEGNGIDITSGVISVDHDGQGLAFSGSQLALELDGSTLSKSASGVKVADLGISNAQISASAAIAYSKLALSNSIVNADINASAAIAYSKLNLSASIVNADIAAAAAIAYNKLATLTSSRALQSDGSGVVSVSAVTSTELGYVSGVTSAIQTQLNTKLANVSEDTDPQLGGNLDLNGNALTGVMRRGSSVANSVEQEYLHNQGLTASTTAVLATLTFDSKVYKSLQIEYMARNGNNRRTGKLFIVCDNASAVASTNVSIFDQSTETADILLSWSAAMNGDNVEISYTTSAGTYSANMDLKRFKA